MLDHRTDVSVERFPVTVGESIGLRRPAGGTVGVAVSAEKNGLRRRVRGKRHSSTFAHDGEC
jgi:hypothetical protein